MDATFIVIFGLFGIVLSSEPPLELQENLPILNLIGNVAGIRTTSTCGEFKPEEFCILTEHKECKICDATVKDFGRSIDRVVDATDSFWKAENFREKVNITIDFGQEFFVASVHLTMGPSPRPRIWVLEKSRDFGRTYRPWQYFASTPSECLDWFGVQPNGKITQENQVLCSTNQSSIDPMTNGEILINLVGDRPGSENFSENPSLQKWTSATNIQLTFLKLRTLRGENIDVDRSLTKRYFYSLNEIAIYGRCICNGHADICTGRPLRCYCKNNTMGQHCSTCKPFFRQFPWKPSGLTEEPVCEECNCYGHSTECVYDKTVHEQNLSRDINGVFRGGGVCLDCRHNTEGNNCHKCKKGFYRRLYSFEINEEILKRPCEECACDLRGSVSYACSTSGGQCPCISPNVTGRTCNKCVYGHWGFPRCLACNCSPRGSYGDKCDPDNGQCSCRPNVSGKRCDQCPVKSKFPQLLTPKGCIECDECHYHFEQNMTGMGDDLSYASRQIDGKQKQFYEIALNAKIAMVHLISELNDVVFRPNRYPTTFDSIPLILADQLHKLFANSRKISLNIPDIRSKLDIAQFHWTRNETGNIFTDVVDFTNNINERIDKLDRLLDEREIEKQEETFQTAKRSFQSLVGKFDETRNSISERENSYVFKRFWKPYNVLKYKLCEDRLAEIRSFAEFVENIVEQTDDINSETNLYVNGQFLVHKIKMLNDKHSDMRRTWVKTTQNVSEAKAFIKKANKLMKMKEELKEATGGVKDYLNLFDASPYELQQSSMGHSEFLSRAVEDLRLREYYNVLTDQDSNFKFLHDFQNIFGILSNAGNAANRALEIANKKFNSENEIKTDNDNGRIDEDERERWFPYSFVPLPDAGEDVPSHTPSRPVPIKSTSDSPKTTRDLPVDEDCASGCEDEDECDCPPVSPFNLTTAVTSTPSTTTGDRDISSPFSILHSLFNFNETSSLLESLTTLTAATMVDIASSQPSTTKSDIDNDVELERWEPRWGPRRLEQWGSPDQPWRHPPPHSPPGPWGPPQQWWLNDGEMWIDNGTRNGFEGLQRNSKFDWDVAYRANGAYKASKDLGSDLINVPKIQDHQRETQNKMSRDLEKAELRCQTAKYELDEIADEIDSRSSKIRKGLEDCRLNVSRTFKSLHSNPFMDESAATEKEKLRERLGKVEQMIESSRLKFEHSTKSVNHAEESGSNLLSKLDMRKSHSNFRLLKEIRRKIDALKHKAKEAVGIAENVKGAVEFLEDAYVAVPLPNATGKGVNVLTAIHLSVRPKRGEGLILTYGNGITEPQITLSIHRGHFVLRVDWHDTVHEIRSQSRAQIENWNGIQITRVGSLVTMTIEPSCQITHPEVLKLSISPMRRFLSVQTSASFVYFAGYPEEWKSQKMNKSSFRGCLDYVFINGHAISLFSAVDFRGSRKFCTNVENQICDKKNDRPSFGPFTLHGLEDLIRLSTDTTEETLNEVISIKLKFRTIQSSGTICKISTAANRRILMQLLILDGAVALEFDNGNGVSSAFHRIRSGTSEYHDGHWHKVKIVVELGKMFIFMTVDNSDVKSEVAFSWLKVQLPLHLQFGNNFNKEQSYKQFWSSLNSISGCIDDVQLGSKPLILETSRVKIAGACHSPLWNCVCFKDLSLPVQLSSELMYNLTSIAFVFNSKKEQATLFRYQTTVNSFAIVSYRNRVLTLYLKVNRQHRTVNLTCDEQIHNGAWHALYFRPDRKGVELVVNARRLYIDVPMSDPLQNFSSQHRLLIGRTYEGDKESLTAFRGCLKDVVLNDGILEWKENIISSKLQMCKL